MLHFESSEMVIALIALLASALMGAGEALGAGKTAEADAAAAD